MKELEAWKLKDSQIDYLIKKNQEKHKQGDSIPANKDGRFVIHKDAKNHYHCILWVPGFDSASGEPTNNPFIQSFDKQTFANTEKGHAGWMGYRVYVIHNPELKEEEKELNDLEDLTRTKAMELLDQKGIKYQKNEKREELISKLNA